MMNMFPHDRPVDSRPANPTHGGAGKMVCGDVSGCVQIGIERKLARRAAKGTLGLSVAAVSLAAFAAFLAGISRIDLDRMDAGQFGFVGDELLEPCKTPRMHPSALLLPEPHPCANPSQVFQNNSRAFCGRLDNLLREHMVAVLAETVYSAGQFLEMPLGRLSAFRLEGSPESEVPILNLTPMFFAEELIFAGYGGAANPEVYADDFSCWIWFGNVLFNDNMYPESILAVNAEIGRTDLPVHAVNMVFRDLDGELLPSTNGSKGNPSVREPDSSGPGIVSYGRLFGARSRNLTPLLGQGPDGSKRLRRLDSGRAYQLGREAGLGALVFVRVMMELYPIDPFLFPSDLADAIERARVLTNRQTEGTLLVAVGTYSDFESHLHTSYITLDTDVILCGSQKRSRLSTIA